MAIFPTNETDAHHDYAFSVAADANIHISEATESGRKGYFCIGCNREMQAVLPKVQNVRRYFRHDPKFIKPSDKCTFKDEEYRRTLAITTLIENKEIKVPPVYKFPPKGQTGLALFLLPGTIVSADRVEKDKWFYEDATGNVQSTSDYQGAAEDILFKADVVFYNENDEPILFIRIGKKKKLTINEQAGLQRLRVNAISLTIPKESAAAIELSQKKGDRAKWLYHDDERQISYFSVPTDLGEGISAIDGDPDILSGESYDCRKVQVNNLIRALSRCLESEPYRATEQRVRTAIGTTELAIKQAGERRDELERRHRTAAEAANRSELDEIDRRGVKYRTTKAKLNRASRNLEERYLTTRSKLEEEARILESHIRGASIAAGGTGKTIEELRTELERSDEQIRSQLDEQFGRAIRSIASEQGAVERAIADARAIVERLRKDITGAPADLVRKQTAQGVYFDELEATEKEIISGLEKERDGRQGNIDAARAAITERFDRIRRLTAVAAENEDVEGGTTLSKRLKALGDARRYILAIENAKANNRRLRKTEEFIKTPAFQTWLSQYQYR